SEPQASSIPVSHGTLLYVISFTLTGGSASPCALTGLGGRTTCARPTDRRTDRGTPGDDSPRHRQFGRIGLPADPPRHSRGRLPAGIAAAHPRAGAPQRREPDPGPGSAPPPGGGGVRRNDAEPRFARGSGV